MTANKGFIYILTNPSFPDYVKIGFAHDVQRRVDQLNRTECTPFAFRIYAQYEVHHNLVDKQLHKLIDGLNGNLRSIDKIKGKDRVREFYAMSPEEAYELLKCIASISGTSDRLTLITPDGEAIKEEETAKQLENEAKVRKDAFSFTKCGIPIGSEIHFQNKPEIVATVISDRQIEFNGETTSLSRSAQEILESKYPIQGPLYWEFQGKTLSQLRHEKEESGTY